MAAVCHRHLAALMIEKEDLGIYKLYKGGSCRLEKCY